MSRHGSLKICLLIITALLFSTTSTAVFAAKPPKTKSAAGRESGTLNTILNGRGAPKVSIGTDGDFFIDVISMTIYGPKKNGKWPTGISLKGPAGADGKAGERGTSGTSSTGVKGDKGDKGDKGEKGERGERGATGATGEAGPQGATGASGPIGATGPAGPSGAAGPQGAAGPAGAVGPAGATGADGAQGAKGDTGAQGPQGETGSQGPVGPSHVQVSTIDSFTVGLATQVNHQSGFFGNLQVGKSYAFEIVIAGDVGSSMGLNRVYGIAMDASEADLTFDFTRVISQATVLDGGVEKYIYSFRIVGTVTAVATASALRVSIFHLNGSREMTAQGKAYIREVAGVS